ncbi:MAG: family 10 glycosylhydrolase [Phycisphaerae bacterium]|nr:family 10 glycosylhydrolase [Phycisphaerae bacterium]
MMNKAAIALLTLVVLATAPRPSAQADEFRGMWVSRFEWPHRDPATCKATIDEIMRSLAEHNFNAVVFQVRGQCDTLYPSPEEPWSPLLLPASGDSSSDVPSVLPLTRWSPLLSQAAAGPGWDPLAYAIEAARENNLEFHAYINTHVAWQSSTKEPPVSRSHMYFKHFNEADPDACDWVVHNADGKPEPWGGDSYVWIAPGVPDAQAYTRRQVMYVVNNYDVDGIHFDRIRTPHPDVSHDPISLARMQPGAEGNPDNLDFAAWTADQFTRFLRDMYAQIAEVRPRIRVSSCPLGLVSRDRYPEYPASFHYGVTKCYQDAQAWLAAGAMDFVVPQIYWADDDKQPDFSRILPDWIAHAADRHIYAGHSTRIGIPELMHQVEITRQQGGLGNAVFSYGTFKEKGGFAQYSGAGGVYEHPVATASMPWKDNPSDGIIIGTVTNAETKEPVVDAQIRRSGDDYVALSSADGLYSFLKVPPGTYTLTVTKSGLPEQVFADIPIAAGQVVRADIALGDEQITVTVAEPREPLKSAPAAVKGPRADARPDQTEIPATDQPFETEVTRERGSSSGRWILIGSSLAVTVALAIAAVILIVRRRQS